MTSSAGESKHTLAAMSIWRKKRIWKPAACSFFQCLTSSYQREGMINSKCKAQVLERAWGARPPAARLVLG